MGFFGKSKGDEIYDAYENDFVDATAGDVGAAEDDGDDRAATTEERSFSGTEIGAAASLELKVVRPDKFEDATGIADHLLAGRTVVLNMDFVNKDVTRRLLDFLSGVAYSIGGKFQRVANGTFIITPRNVEVSEAKQDDDNADGNVGISDVQN